MRKISGKYNKLLSELTDSSDNIVMVCHHNPDGDAIGSMLGLYRYLQYRGKESVMISPNHVQEFLRWMINIDSVIIACDEPGRAVKHIMGSDLIIMLDFNHIDRAGALADHILASSAGKILIDHHPGPEINVDLLISEPGYSSTAELIFNLTGELEGNYFTDGVFMEAVYTGMITDTGNFSFGTYNGDTLRDVAVMLDNGLDKDRITDRIYDNFSVNRLRLRGFVTYERLIFLEQYCTACIYIRRSDLDRFNYRVGDTEGFVNIPLSVKGIIMSALFIEKEGHIKVSLRSKGDFNVNKLAAAYFSGGGHKNAAGGRYEGNMDECLSFFEKVLEGIDELQQKNTG